MVNMQFDQDTVIYITGMTGLETIFLATVSDEFDLPSGISEQGIMLKVKAGSVLVPTRIYYVTLDIDNGLQEQESPVVQLYGNARVESPIERKTITFNLALAVFDTVYSWGAFGVLDGMRPLKIVEPNFELLGPFLQSNPTGKMRITLQMVVQMNVELSAGSHIAFRGFYELKPSKTVAARVTCYTTDAFAEQVRVLGFRV